MAAAGVSGERPPAMSAAAMRDTGHGAEAARLLRRALALWRGPALAGLTGRVVEAGAARRRDR